MDQSSCLIECHVKTWRPISVLIIWHFILTISLSRMHDCNKQTDRNMAKSEETEMASIRPATSVAVNIGIDLCLNAVMTSLRSIWLMSPCRRPTAHVYKMINQRSSFPQAWLIKCPSNFPKILLSHKSWVFGRYWYLASYSYIFSILP